MCDLYIRKDFVRHCHVVMRHELVPRKRAADVQTEDLEDNEQLDADESTASLPQVEGESSDERMFTGNWEHNESETHNPRLEDKVAGDGYLGPDKKWTTRR